MAQIGIVAFQGDVSEHVRAMENALKGRGSVILVRRAGIVPECDGLVLPGGESTAISKQLEGSGVGDEIKAAAKSGVPIMATCAGLVLVSKEVEGDSKGGSRVEPLSLMDIKIGRNAFGPQRESFEADLDIKGLEEPYRAIFIRAPAIVDVGKDVDVLALIDDLVVAVRQGNIMGVAFHPELTDDGRIHKIFLEMVEA